MATPINTIYSWFETGDFPTQAQFQASWSSFWHKDEKLPMSSITGLSDQFGKYVLVSTFNSHLDDQNAHPYFAKKDASNIEGANVDNWRTALQIEDLKIGFAADGTLANGLDVPLEKVTTLGFSGEDFEYELGDDNETVLVKKRAGSDENITRIPTATYSELGITPESTLEEKQIAIATFLQGYDNLGTDVLFFEITEI